MVTVTPAATENPIKLANRLMAMALLHRYSNLPWYLQRLPLPGAQRLEQLAAHWWNLNLD